MCSEQRKQSVCGDSGISDMVEAWCSALSWLRPLGSQLPGPEGKNKAGVGWCLPGHAKGGSQG